uniref:Amino acid adenylation domain protein n=1 Tax=uncultured Acidobacteria bacterium C5 TaxID=1036856 RepID=F8TTM9_9BACT|nr:amino acid adenylation domain protein [uncultured Acidobacteria bacterium C5]
MKSVKPESPTTGELTPLQKAFLTIRTLRTELDAARAARFEPIAVVGLGCRVPGADGPDAFWTLLSEGRDAITEVPASRWDINALYDPRPGTPGKVYSRYGGFLDHVELFDAAFFGISSREAATIDPQQRLLLEVAWEALEHAGIAPSSLKSTPTGVFVGVTSSDYACLQLEQNSLPDDPYFSSGAALNACAGRVSYVLGLQGPCMAVDTACSSSLTAVHLACSALRNRECDAALAGGVNLMLATWPHVTLAAAQMVAPDGRCKTFDASADGYVRGEGCGIVVLKRLSDAVNAGDRVLALIRGTAVNQDGASSGFTVPNGVAQQALIRQTLAAAGVEAGEIDYVESHGTGTALGDPIEAGALGAVLGRAATRERPLWIGSVKSNIGHLESAAGVTGLIKLVLALGHGRIPRTLHVHQQNPRIDWDGLHLRTAGESVEWPRGARPRLAALSAFGVSGSNAHLIIQEAPLATVARPERDRPVHVLTLSAKSQAALVDLAAAYDEFLAGQQDEAIGDICSSANRGRSHFKHRAAICASSIEQLRAGLAGIGAGQHLQLPAPDGAAEEWHGRLVSLAEAYVNGTDVDWAALDESIPRNRVSLPTYRFQRKRYWITERDEIMTPAPTESTVPEADARRRHRESVKADLIGLVADVLREEPAAVPLDVPFLEMGADSLILVYAARRIDERFGVKVEIRQFFEEISSVASLADYVADRVPLPAVAPSSPVLHAAPVAVIAAPAATITHAAPPPAAIAGMPIDAAPMVDASSSEFARIIDAQMQLMSRQLDLLARASGTSRPSQPAHAPIEAARAAAAPAAAVARSSPLNDIKHGITAKPTGMTEQQQRSLAEFIERFTKRTQRSKALAESCRPGLADSRATVGFRFSTKEILYPITGAVALGSSLEDVDGNSYIDLTMGFGALLFGSRPDFVVKAIAAELQRGIQLGMRSDLMEEITRLFCELTGKQRVVFTNSGTEAVMTALRLARAATGRSKIALFEGAYHGHSDGTLAQRTVGNTPLNSEPVAPGIPANVARDVLVLEYGTPQALETIRSQAHELAAVLVEPVQSRRPDFQPVAFLKELRAITEASGTALIFDEMITGFRAHPAGCQGLFGIEADIATYGKIIGGGMPIGACAGSARFLDGIDGGTWRFGDQSYPGAARTYFGGTFCQHPIAMAASLAVLRHLKAQGSALQTALNQRTADFAETLNAFFAAEGLAIRVSYFSSIFRFEFSGNLELFFYHMLEKGIYIWEWRNCFLSTAHTDDDLARVIRAVKESVADLRAAGFLPAGSSAPVVAVHRSPVEETAAVAKGFWDRGKSKLGQRETAASSSRTIARRPANKALAFSLSYFGTYEAAYSPGKYELLIEGARFADAEGFEAVWVPERHFHEFGGLSPNPSVLAAALARETTRVQLRAGSVVTPLHHPMRVAEEWSMVDNLAGGRVGIAFASGWHPNDFVFAPQHYGKQREITFENMETVRRIWRGEAVSLRDGAGKDVDLKLHPLPSQKELPCWLTIVNNRETYRKAGELGVGVLTNLMGQTLDELTANIASYRETLAEHGHDPDAGTVTVLLHTYVRDDAAQAIREARRPLCDYLLSSMTLFKQLARSQGLAIDLDGLSAVDREYIVQTAYDKYVAHSALIGSPETCRPIVERLIEAGVDELACFIDFGVPTDLALSALPPLNDLRKRWSGAGGSTAPASFPMSEAQRQLWLLAKMSDEGANAYNDPAVVTVEGAIDLDALASALTHVVSRHESLRTTVDPLEDRLIVHAPAPITPAYIDVSMTTDPDREVRAHLEQFNRTLIDFVNGPVFTATLLKVAEQRHVLVLGSHHLLTDGLSMLNVINELNASYVARRRGELPALASPLQYRDFVRWHDDQASAPAMKAHEEYWLRQCTEPPAPADVPADRPRPAVKTFNGAVRQLEIDKALVSRATKLAGSRGYTPFMLLLAVYDLLLHRLSGQERIVVGCPSAGRGLERGDSVVGYCAHLLPIITTVPASSSSRLTFAEHLRRVRGTLLDAFQHQDYPFARLLNKLALKRDISRTPLISTIFNLERPSFESLEGGLTLGRRERQVTFARMDLTLTANVFDSGVVLECDYNTDLFDAATIDRLLMHYRTLLESVVEHPDADVHALPLLDESMRLQHLRSWNESEPQIVDRLVQQLFESQAAQQPDAIAVCERRPGGDRRTYRALNERANQLAHVLRRSGIGPEQRVGVYLERSVDLFVALLGILKAGAAYVPIDPAYPAARVEQIQNDAQIAMLVTKQDRLAGLPAPPGSICCLDRDSDRLDAESTANPAVAVDLDNPAYVIYTSGSTGRPKGVVVLHRGLTNYLQWAARSYQAEGGGTPVLGSVGFDATITSLFVPLVAGGYAELLPEGEELTAVADALGGDADYRFVKITPAHLDAVNRLLTGGTGAGGTRRLVLGGEAISPLALASWTRDERLRVVNEYGPTETVVGCCTHEFSGWPGDSVPIGRPISGARLHVLDDHLELVPVGVPGELYIGGIGVARGYLGRPDLTASAFVPDPFAGRGGTGTPGDRLYKTGDRARYRADGNLEYLGRVDGQIKLRGFRIELAEIETVVLQRPDVLEAVVMLREDEPGQPRIVAYVRPAEHADFSMARLRDDLKRLLPDYMIPSAFVRVHSMPLTTNGKVDRAALPEPDHDRPEQSAEFAAPRGPIEDALAAIWRDVLNLNQVGAHDNFFDLGGTSLLVVEAFRRMAGVANGTCRVLDLFKYPTIRSLAAFLGHGDASPQDGDEEIRQRVRRQKSSARKQASRRSREMTPQV